MASQEASEVEARSNAPDEESTLTEMDPCPSSIQHQIMVWDRLKAEYDADLAAKENVPIKVTMVNDGAVIKALTEKPLLSWKTTPYQIACRISISLKRNSIVARVDGKLWDLDRPLEGDCTLELCDFKDDEAKQVFWHSTAHVLGQALEQHYERCLCVRLSSKDDFYHDICIEQENVSPSDFPKIEKVMREIIEENQRFERLEMKKKDLEEMFQYNQFKLWIIENQLKLQTAETIPVYRSGPLIDLCFPTDRCPAAHVRRTGLIKSFKITNNSSSHWEGEPANVLLQRVYGISFPDNGLLEKWQKNQDLVANKDHRKIGSDQELFFFHELSPRSCFFLPNGTHIYDTLLEFICSEYRKRGFKKVKTPTVFNINLWETSGHWKHYQENMFSFKLKDETFAMKPMNCPGHCLIFDKRVRSFCELPLRWADFGVLHRNEIKGSLTGLTRVRQFQQDDAHIFCRMDQLESEINDALSFIADVYKVFGFRFNLCVSKRPDGYMGVSETWDTAEALLEKCLRRFTGKDDVHVELGDGAFYGPKIDVTISDSKGRNHQCATIQLDFQLPIKFDLNFINETGKKECPVIIHRAILGSVERMMAILMEDCEGKWPFWLNPKQCMVVPVGPHCNDYANQVRDKIRDAGFQVDADCDSGVLFEKKIRNAQLAQYNFVLVVGKKEEQNKTVNVRMRDINQHSDKKEHGEYSVERVVQLFTQLSNDRAPNSKNKVEEYEKMKKILEFGVEELVNEKRTEFTRNQLVDLQSQLNTRIQLESASNGAGVELAREQVVILAKQFKELAKRHLHIIAYFGEGMYNGLEMKTKEFVKNLNLSLSLVNDDVSASQKIQGVIDVVTLQLKDIETCRQDFKTKVDVLMDRVDMGIIQFADLDVKASRPQFKIAPESFEEVFQNLTGFSDVNSIFDSIQLIQVASQDA